MRGLLYPGLASTGGGMYGNAKSDTFRLNDRLRQQLQRTECRKGFCSVRTLSCRQIGIFPYALSHHNKQDPVSNLASKNKCPKHSRALLFKRAAPSMCVTAVPYFVVYKDLH